MTAEGPHKEPWHHEGAPSVLAGEPRLVYQPVVDLGSGQLLGFEALIRWHHPTEGVILPSLLIPWAEANGDMVALGSWVLHEGCREATRWPSNIQLAVNCSIVQLRATDGSTAVRSALEGSGLAADRLTVEFTEGALNDEAAVAALHRIGELGVQLAVDDVGTSWNSFEALHRMGVNLVKIDNSFVLGLEPDGGINRTIVETVVHVAHTCGMSVVAEGVETELHASIVGGLDAEAAQGYYFAPPLSQKSATKMANLEDLRFPLEGPGWRDDDDWPFAGASEGNGRLVGGPSAKGGRGLAVVMPTNARIELDDIDLVDLVLDKAAHPDNGAAASGPIAPANGEAPPVDPEATGAGRDGESLDTTGP